MRTTFPPKLTKNNIPPQDKLIGDRHDTWLPNILLLVVKTCSLTDYVVPTRVA